MYKHVCIYILLLEPEFSTVTRHMAVTARVGLRGGISVTLSVFCKVFLKLRTLCRPDDNVAKKKKTIFR